ncbi:hypothetical protein [Methylocystis sp.]|uniref:hypothetical protein n=1 Tax=Methylocystis sp. TaxID=1911079 RepID=UPI003DA6014A
MSIVAEIATKITMADGVSAVLAGIAKQTLHLEGSVMKLEKTFAGLNKTTLAVVGSMAAIGGATVLGALKNVADHGDKLLDQQFKLRNLGVQQNEILKLQAEYFANVGKAVPTSTVDEYLKTVRELRAVTGGGAEGLAAAARMAPNALMMNELLGNEMGTKAGDEYYKLLRSAEMKGIATNPEKREAFINEAYKYIAGFGGKLTANDFQTIARRGGVAWMNARPEAIGPIAVLGADLGGSQAGTTLMTLQQLQMGATTLSKQQGEVLSQLGLLDMSKTTATGFGGGRLQVAPGGIRGSLEHMGDLPGWIKEVVYPALQKASGGNPAMLQSLLAKISPNRNAAKLVQMFGDEGFLDQIAKDLGIAGDVRDIRRGYSDYSANNPVGVKKAFASQYESMMQAIGAPMMQAAIPVMKAVTELFTKIGAWANANPGIITAYGEALAKIGAGLFGAGTLAVITAISAFLGPAGGIILGFSALYAVLGLIAKINWPGFLAPFKGFGEAALAVSKIGWNIMAVGFETLAGVLKILPGVANDVATAFGRLGDWLKGLVDKILGWVGLGGGGSYADSAARMRGMNVGSAGGVMSRVGGGNLGFSPQGPIGTGSGSDVKSMIDAAADRHGVDRRVMYGIVAGESSHGNHYDVGDGGKSFGPFQLYRGGGLGNVFERQTGLSVRDPKNLPAMADFTAAHIKRTGDLSPWHGFHGRRNWNPSWGNMGYSPGPPPQKREDHSRMRPINIQINGRTLASITSEELYRLHKHERIAPFAPRSAWLSPSHQFWPG